MENGETGSREEEEERRVIKDEVVWSTGCIDLHMATHSVFIDIDIDRYIMG
jgi:hypothetical protein